MKLSPTPRFRGGRNIAIKVPPHAWEATVAFYRDVLGLKAITRHAPDVGFEFGANQLWIDRAPGLSQAETWLEILVDDADVGAAAERLEQAGIVRCDAIEPLGEGSKAFWIMSPASVVHLVCPAERAW
jgi:catechol 2,3-dioxygenase-like lactoylglutathione lyase family enzyme